MAKNASSDMVTFLGNNIATLTAGTNLFWGKTLSDSDDVPTNAVFVSQMAGPTPQRSMGEVSELRRTQVMILVRWATNAAGKAIAESIQDKLQAVTITGYQDVAPLQSGVAESDTSASGDHFWVLVYELVHEYVAT